MSNLLVKFPSRERPTQFMDRLNTMVQMADKASELFFLFTFDANDSTMFPVAKMIEGSGLNGEIHFGTSKSKIDAVNRDMEKVEHPWDILLLMSDDMVCKVKGWDTTVKSGFLDPAIECLWFYDGHQKDICTMPIMRRAYYDRFKYIYHPAYRSLFCDDEQTAVAKRMNVLKYSDTVLFHHVHPANVTGVVGDKLHIRNEMAWDVDQKTFNERKAKGFPR